MNKQENFENCICCGTSTRYLDDNRKPICLDCQDEIIATTPVKPITIIDCKDESLRDYIIESILNNNEPDQILIDLLNVDLYALAEEQLDKASTKQLKDIFER